MHALRRSAPIPLFFSLASCLAPELDGPADPAATELSLDVSQAVSISSAATMVAALDISPVVQVSGVSLVSPHAHAALDVASLGTLAPSKGSSFVLLSTGKSGDPMLTAEPGFDFAPTGEAGDVVTFRFDVFVPHYLNQMSFDYTFLSSEFPEYVASAFTDRFTVTVTDWIGDRVMALESVNNPQMRPATAAKVGPGPFLLVVPDASLVDTTFGAGNQLDAGVVDLRRATIPIRHGWMTVQFDIRDVGDGILDSTAIIDNLSFSAVETLDPQGNLLETTGGITHDTLQLATEGTPVRAVVADGATPLLLRSKAPGPGEVTITLASGSASDGSLSRHQAQPQWGTSVTVDTVFVNGGHYAFVLYQSPADFNRGADQLLRERVAPLTWAYASDSGTGDYAHGLELPIVRPAVVVVPDLWSSCAAWTTTGLLHPNPPTGDPRRPFLSSCVTYDGARGFDHGSNQLAVSGGVAGALSELRAKGVATTQVDVVGHGSGGVLARRFLDAPLYRRANNFQQGDVNRLITMNTPHLGARMADEIVAFREHARSLGGAQWSTLNAALQTSRIFLEPAEGYPAIDELRTTSPIIRALQQATVPFHALIGAGGRSLARPALPGMLPVMLPLYEQMEQFHPATYGRAPAVQQQLFLGAAGRIFCGDAIALPEEDHDLFATSWEQRNGLADAFVTKLPVGNGDPTSGHFQSPASPAYVTRLIQLLNAPLGGGLFSPTIAATPTVPLLNSCPDPR